MTPKTLVGLIYLRLRLYAEEKLRSKGYRVVPTEGAFKLMIHVSAFRISSGLCVGLIGIELSKAVIHEVFAGFLVVAEENLTIANYENANQPVIEQAQKLIESFD